MLARITRNALQTLTAVIAVGTLAACGGGGSSSPGGDGIAAVAPLPSAIDRSGVTVGTITGFGSVIVAGVTFDTNDAMFVDDDVPATEADFSVGQVVQIRGVKNDDGVTGVADRVLFEAEVEGPVSSIDLVAGSFVVLGRTIRTDVETRFDDDFELRSLEGLTVGATVEVSGFAAADGGVLATHIEPEDELDELKVQGVVRMLDADMQRFMLGELVVDFALATLRGFDGEPIADGDQVRVLGEELDADGLLIATVVALRSDALVRRDDDDDFDDDDDVEIEGLITELGVDSFRVGRQLVRVDAGTEFENGTFDDLLIDLRVEVEGGFDADGVLLADEVEIRRTANAVLEGRVDSIDVDANTLVVSGITVTVERTTQFEDDSNLDIRRFSLADMSVGDFVEIKGLAADGAILARRVERDEDDGDDAGFELEGPVDAFGADSVTVLGFALGLGANTGFEMSDAAVSEQEFRAAVSVGSRVEVEAVQAADGSFIVGRIEREEDDDDV